MMRHGNRYTLGGFCVIDHRWWLLSLWNGSNLEFNASKVTAIRHFITFNYLMIVNLNYDLRRIRKCGSEMAAFINSHSDHQAAALFLFHLPRHTDHRRARSSYGSFIATQHSRIRLFSWKDLSVSLLRLQHLSLWFLNIF